MSRQQHPLIEDVEESRRIPLLLTKLKQCEARCDFSNPRVDFVRKEIKRKALVDIIDYLNNTPGVFQHTSIYGPIMRMVAANLFRALQLNTAGDDLYDPEEDEARLEPAWPHLQIVYEILRRFVVATDTDTKVARKYLDQVFVLGLLDLFNSEDPREREYLKTIIHRIYGKIMSLRAFIRTNIQNTFHYYVYEHQHHNGIAEMLEILGSIINGFATPLKDDHRAFLIKSLIPLHTPKGLPTYHVQLSFCVTQFVEKEPELAVDVVLGLVKIWPITHSRKEVMFLNELEEVLELTRPEEFELIIDPLFRYLARCINSSHFQVAERALFFWNNEYIVHLILHFRELVLPLVFESLQSNVQHHWNQNVVSLSHNVQKLMAEMDIELYEQYADGWMERQQEAVEQRARSKSRWERVEHMAALNATAASAATHANSAPSTNRNSSSSNSNSNNRHNENAAACSSCSSPSSKARFHHDERSPSTSPRHHFHKNPPLPSSSQQQQQPHQLPPTAAAISVGAVELTSTAEAARSLSVMKLKELQQQQEHVANQDGRAGMVMGSSSTTTATATTASSSLASREASRDAQSNGTLGLLGLPLHHGKESSRSELVMRSARDDGVDDDDEDDGDHQTDSTHALTTALGEASLFAPPLSPVRTSASGGDDASGSTTQVSSPTATLSHDGKQPAAADLKAVNGPTSQQHLHALAEHDGATESS